MRIEHATHRVSGDVNSLLLGVCNQLGLLQTRVALDLVDRGDNARGLDDALELQEN